MQISHPNKVQECDYLTARVLSIYPHPYTPNADDTTVLLLDGWDEGGTVYSVLRGCIDLSLCPTGSSARGLVSQASSTL